jgi:hypothetical protein
VERRQYTQGEIGILRDIGWSAIPEPGQVAGLMLIAIIVLCGTYLRRRRSGLSA